MKYDVIVVGGGAAGLMCAIEAGKRGRKVVVLEHNERLGNKILISGGGRCNFTNLHAGPENYLSANPHFCRSALARYTPADFIALVERHGVSWHEKKLGQLFCDTSSREIVQLLEAEAAAAGVGVRLNCRVLGVRKPAAFEVVTSLGSFTADALVVACGGLSFPRLGATDLGLQLARQFDLNLIPARPGLVPFFLPGEDRAFCAELSGVSLEVVASAAGGTAERPSFRENMLFTHQGLSGPAILQISSHGAAGDRFHLDLLPGQSALELLLAARGQPGELVTFLARHWPRRLAQSWCARHGPSRRLSSFSIPELESIARHIHRWEILPAAATYSVQGYEKAEVTVGGVDTRELSSKTMEARRVPGLYFVGEVVDVTGWLGGYNFQWAWASGFAAGQYV